MTKTGNREQGAGNSNKAADQVQDLFLEQLVRSRFEPRKNIDPAALAELADSIRTNGVLEPLIVRPVLRVDGLGRPCFEIGAGQRRWEASKLAGKTTAPCLVRELTDEQFRELAIISNLQRQDLEAMDEAEAYARLLEIPGSTIETVAAKVAKSPSYVGRRLKLLDAIEPVRRALKCGAIEVGHALELGRLSARQQAELLEWLEIGYEIPEDGEEEDDPSQNDLDDEGVCKYCDDGDDELETSGRAWSNEKHTVCDAPTCMAAAEREAAMGGWRPARESVADLRKRIAQTELRILAQAPFPLEDEIPPMACTECPKRSGNTHGLFDDVLQDTCTDPACYETKLKFWVRAELQKTPKLVMLYDGHANDKAGVSKWSVVVNAECTKQEAAIWVSGRLIGRRVSICRDKNCKGHDRDTSAAGSGGKSSAAPRQVSAADKAKAEAQKAERAKLLKKVEAEQAYRERLWARLVAAGVPDAAEPHIVRNVCSQVAGQGGGLIARLLGMPDDAFEYGKRAQAQARVVAMPYKTVLRAAALALVVSETGASEYAVSQGLKPAGMEELAKLFNLDLAAIRSNQPAKKEPAKRAASKPPAKPAPKKKAAKAAKKKAGGGR